jgi:hypothetical protein
MMRGFHFLHCSWSQKGGVVVSEQPHNSIVPVVSAKNLNDFLVDFSRWEWSQSGMVWL